MPQGLQSFRANGTVDFNTDTRGVRFRGVLTVPANSNGYFDVPNMAPGEEPFVYIIPNGIGQSGGCYRNYNYAARFEYSTPSSGGLSILYGVY